MTISSTTATTVTPAATQTGIVSGRPSAAAAVDDADAREVCRRRSAGVAVATTTRDR